MAFNDDMMTPQGSLEGTAVNFGNSWKADQTCLDVGRMLENPCSDRMETGKNIKFILFQSNEIHCSILFNSKAFLLLLCE